MNKNLPKLFISFALITACAGTCACPGSGRPQKEGPALGEVQNDGFRILTIGTADSGGTMYPVGNAIAQAIGGIDGRIKVNISASNGSSTNVEGIVNSQIDLGLVSGDVAGAAYNGTGDFSGAPVENLRAIAAVYTSVSNWIAPDSGGLTHVHDLMGKRIAVGPQESATELSALIALKAVGLDASNAVLKNYGLGSGGIEVERGNIDALHGFAGIPINGLQRLAESVPCHLLQYTDGELEQILSRDPYYYRTVIPAGTYSGQGEAIDTFGVKCLICVREDMDEDLVYEITRSLAESVPQLAKAHDSMRAMEEDGFMCRDLPLPLHPGAERYYRDMGADMLQSP